MTPLLLIIFSVLMLLVVANGNTPGIKSTGVKRIFAGQRKILEENFLYYNNLSESEKKEFIRRINLIVKSKFFVSKNNFFITSTMKTLVAGAQAQLTFGIKNFLLSDYKTINIYPDAFENHQTHKLHRGETNTLGYISLSWKHFIYGYNIPNDRLNVGLHEMAHALLNTILFNRLIDDTMEDKLILLDKIPEEEKVKLFDGTHPFFRDYANTNIKEFFAVSIECFFEMPEEFSHQFPTFYNYIAFLLNQDPAKKQYRSYSPVCEL